MNSPLFSLKLKDLAGAIVSGVIMAVLGYLGTLADIFEADPRSILGVALTAAIASLLKAFTTTSDGKFLGAIKVK